MGNKTVKKQESEYIHINKESLKTLGIFLIGIFLLTLAYFNLRLIFYKWKDLGLDLLNSCTENCNDLSSWIQLDIIPNILIEVLLFLFGIIFLFNLFNEMDWKGLIIGLIIGLIAGLIAGLIKGLIAGLITGLILGLIVGLIAGLIAELIEGLEGKD